MQGLCVLYIIDNTVIYKFYSAKLKGGHFKQIKLMHLVSTSE